MRWRRNTEVVKHKNFPLVHGSTRSHSKECPLQTVSIFKSFSSSRRSSFCVTKKGRKNTTRKRRDSCGARRRTRNNKILGVLPGGRTPKILMMMSNNYHQPLIATFPRITSLQKIKWMKNLTKIFHGDQRIKELTTMVMLSRNGLMMIRVNQKLMLLNLLHSNNSLSIHLMWISIQPCR